MYVINKRNFILLKLCSRLSMFRNFSTNLFILESFITNSRLEAKQCF